NVQDVAVCASSDSTRPGGYVFAAINHSSASQIAAIGGVTLSSTAHPYRMTAASAQNASLIEPLASGTMAASGAVLSVSLPALSATTIDVY
ncbi:MAG: hypothetical protein ABSE43_08815, partial [Steroidobacteraceae bacterium]